MNNSLYSLRPDRNLTSVIAELEALRDQRPLLALSAGRSIRTRTTIAKILEATRTVFSRDGHAALTLRHVAEEAGIAVGNLTYHFGTKKELLEAMMSESVADNIDEHLARFTLQDKEPFDRLLDIIEFYIVQGGKTHKFYLQIWGYAAANDDARQFVRNAYQPIGRLLHYLIGAANPNLTDDDIKRAVLQLFSLIEGYKLFMGLNPGKPTAANGFADDIRVATKLIVSGDFKPTR